MSGLREKLQRLRHTAPTPAAESVESSLVERLGRLRPREYGSDAQCESDPPADLAAILGGNRLSEHVVVVDRQFPLTSRHGRFTLDQVTAERARAIAASELENLLFIDTETNGLAGGAGTVAFLVGLGRFRSGVFHLRQLLLTAFAGEADLLGTTAQWCERATTLVSFNGKSFDAPLLATRYCLAQLANPFLEKPHVDLLHHVRRVYSGMWTDYRLATAEQVALDLQRTDDLPGAMVPMVWWRWLRFGDASQMPAVLEHNRLDLLSLATLLPALANATVDPLAEGANPLTVARSHWRQGQIALARRVLEQARSQLSAEGLRELAQVYRRERDWSGAEAVWRELAAGGCAESSENLAKYYEHQLGDPARALEITEALLARFPGEDALLRRCRRLHRKLGRFV